MTISSAEELKSFRDAVNNGNNYSGVTVSLTADINLNSEAWTPIGASLTVPFSGTFDGGGYTIRGLYVNSDADHQGLFGCVSSGCIQNLSVEGSVAGANNVGGIVGTNLNGTIANCTFIGTVTGSLATPGETGPYAGGAAGWNSGTIQSCINKGSVNGTLVGGVVGWNSGTVANCLNSGEVNGTYTGGIAVQSIGRVENCFNTGTVSGGFSAVVARNDGGSVTNCYYLEGTVQKGVGQGTGSADGKTTEQVKSGEVANLLQGTQSDTVWGQTIGEDGYPVLTGDTGKKVVKVTFQMDDVSVEKYMNAGNTLAESDFPDGATPDAYHYWMDGERNRFTSETIVTADVTVQYKFFMEGEGTEESPYLIPDAQTLKTFRDYVNGVETFAGKYVQMTADIDLNNEAWTPIGNYRDFNTSLHFDGSFDGGSHIISNLNVSAGSGYRGLFGCLNGGTIKNLSVSGSVSGSSYVGGIVSLNKSGFITCCSFSGNISASGANAGGITGLNDNGTVMNCASAGEVSAGNSAGGIVGQNDGTISDCENSAKVGSSSGNAQGIGGIAGRNTERSTAIIGCTNRGWVNGQTAVGGISGTNFISVCNCANYGEVSAAGVEAGGIIGRNMGAVANCANSGSVTGAEDSVGGIVGTNEKSVYGTGSVSDCSNIGSVSGSGDVGGVAGYHTTGEGNITNCYYLEGMAENGIGSGTGDAVRKTAEAYSSGEVAYLLQRTQKSLAWGQKLGEEDYPLLTSEESKRVLSVTFQTDTEKFVVYVNAGGRVTVLPDAPAESQGERFNGWKTEDGQSFTADTVVYSDMTVTALYGEEKTVSVAISWGAMEFTFKDSIWNTDTLTYEKGGWTADKEGGGRITAENTGETDVTVSYEYKQTDTAVSGSFTDAAGAVVAGGISLSTGEKLETHLILDGKPSVSDTATYEVGVVTVAIGR